MVGPDIDPDAAGDLAIGIGTMIGVGIFVFPGLAAENAGLAATLSFAVDGLIALLVALSTSELAPAITTEVAREESALDAIVDSAESYDAVVMGETDPSLTTFVFGMPMEQVAERFLGPVLVVQRERPPEEDEEDA